MKASLTDLRHRLPVETYVAGLTVLMWIVLAFSSPYFWTGGNVTNILRQVSIAAVIAYGELFTVILAGIDLSVGSVAGLSGIVFAMILSAGYPILLALVAGLAVGFVIGTVNALASDRLGIPPFIVTLAGLQAFRGLALLMSGGMTIAGLPNAIGTIANTTIFHIPTLFVVMAVIGVCSHFVLRYTRLGRYMYAIGSNAESARRVGIDVTFVTLVAYCVSAVFAAVGGMLLVARLSMGTPTAATGYELQAIAAAVVGGASLFGGRGTIIGCFIGALLFTTIGNGANLLGVDPFWEMVIEGLLIAAVVYLDNIQKRRQAGIA
ncbi:MAG TPA: ABC transporter permease [Acetobacteraceae bacterium]|nr:ABC transporter permease [Acetobacteraceae bacterium]